MLETLNQNQDIATFVMITTSATLGLILVGLIIQAMNYVRVFKLLQRVETSEARILARLMIAEDEYRQNLVSYGSVPVTLEDLIKRDLEDNFYEDPDNLVPPTDEDLKRMMEDVHGKSKS